MQELHFIEKEIVIPGLKDTYRILQITDAHVVLMDDRANDYVIDEGAHTGKRLVDFGAMRYRHFTINGKTTAQHFSELCDRLQSAPDCADMIVFTGDILDFYTDAVFEFVCDQLKKLPIPFMFTPGNHDMIFTSMTEEEIRTQFSSLCGGNTELQSHKLGELTLIGIDNTRDYYSDKALADLDAALVGQEHVLLFQHIPLSTKKYHEFAMARANRDLGLGDQGVCVGDSWKTIFDRITAPDSPIRAVICGDCHADHVSYLGNAVLHTSALTAENPPIRFTIHG